MYFYLLYLSQDPGCKIGDCSNGKGIYYFSNGDIYIGFHKNDQRHDTGKYIWSDGDLYEGEWYNNQQQAKLDRIIA